MSLKIKTEDGCYIFCHGFGSKGKYISGQEGRYTKLDL